MSHEFEKCNSCSVFNGLRYIEGDGYDIFNKQEKYIIAGLVPDYDNDIFIRPGYGALCFCCGSVNNLDDVFLECYKYNNFYDIPGKLEKGYKFVIGPGVDYNYLDGNVKDFAVYCSNYKEFLCRTK